MNTETKKNRVRKTRFYAEILDEFYKRMERLKFRIENLQA